MRILIKDIKSCSSYELIFLIYLLWISIRSAFTNTSQNTVWIVSYIRPLTYSLEFGLLLLMLGLIIKEVKIPKKGLKLYVGILLIILVYVLSFVINIEVLNISNAVKFLIGYLKFIIIGLYTIIYLTRSKFNFNYILKFIVFIHFLQFLLNLLWKLGFQFLRNDRVKIYNNQDWAYGTFENTVIIALLSCTIFIYAYFLWFEDRRKGAYPIILIITATLNLAWAEVKVNFLSIAITLFIINLILSKRVNLFKIFIIPLMAFGLFIGVAMQVYSNKYAFNKGGIIETVSYLTRVVGRSSEYNFKIIYLDDYFTKVSQEVPFHPLGAGPGVLGSHFALENPTSLSRKYLIPLYERNYYYFFNSSLTAPDFGFGAILSDLGIIGFVVYFGFISYLILTAVMNLRKGQLSRDFKLGSVLFVGTTINLLMTQVFFDSLYYSLTTSLMWFWGFSLYMSYSKD